MAETMPFTIGAEASCTDGVCGKVSRIVVNPVARVITHLVVEPRRLHGAAASFLFDLVEATTGEVRLRCTRAEFEALDPTEETRFVLEPSITRLTARNRSCSGPITPKAAALA